jgi:hypothetical protein
MDQPTWGALPQDILYTHILPKCDIDTRLAFKLPPSRLCLQSYETGYCHETLRRRYAPDPTQQVDGEHNVLIPMHTIAGWHDINARPMHWHRQAMVNLSIHYNFAGYRRNKAFDDSIQITVIRIDYRDPSKAPPISETVATLWIRPRPL